MDGQTATQNTTPVIPVSFCEEKTGNNNLASECRNLIAVLSRKIENLCRECGEDRDRILHIRSLTASLVTLNSLLKTLEQEQLGRPGNSVFEDAHGITYRSVRNCDLEQWFSIK